MPESFDYVVVGAGSAGCVVASRLAEYTRASVCLLESGPPDRDRAEILELGRWAELVGSRFEQSITARLGARTVTYRRGLVQGGSGSLNGCVAWRAPASDLLAWAAAGAEGWGPDECAPFFDRAVAQTGLETAPPASTVGTAFVTAAHAAGYSVTGTAAEAAEPGAGPWTLTRAGALRRSSSVAYLHGQVPANLEIRTGSGVAAILFRDTTAVGVRTVDGDLFARREIVLCAGAIGSPQLLMLSGVGPADQLGALGIPVVADLPVGERLLDHAIVAAVYAGGRTGRRSSLGTDAVLLATLGGTRPQVMVWPYEGHHDEFYTERPAEPARTCSMVVMLLHPSSTGAVRLHSADPADVPVIEASYLADPGERAVAAAGLRLVRELSRRAPLAEVLAGEIMPGTSVSDSELQEYAAATVEPANHLAGTCRMGAVGASVVDPRLRVRGVSGLRVADASVFPGNVGVNPNLTCLMIGERCAALMAAEACPPRKIGYPF
jgi:choline oxidase